jgi:hypothetical protein
MSKEKLKQDSLQDEGITEEGKDRREFIKKCLVGVGVGGAAVAASASFVEPKTAAAMTTETKKMGTAELAEVAEATVSFDKTPVIVSGLPNVVVKQNFSMTTAVAGELSNTTQVMVNGKWENHAGPFAGGYTYAGWSSSGILTTDPGEITSPGLYRLTIGFSSDGGVSKKVFGGPSFEIVDPNPVALPSYDPATGVLDLPSVEVGNETYTVELKWDEGSQSFKISSCVMN